MLYEQATPLLTWMTNETSGSEELPTAPKGATGMGKTLVASRCQARGLHPDLRAHAISGSRTGEVEWEDKDPNSETEESQDFGDTGGVTPEGANKRADSSMAQNRVRIDTPDVVGTTSAKNVSEASKVCPSANSGNTAC